MNPLKEIRVADHNSKVLERIRQVGKRDRDPELVTKLEEFRTKLKQEEFAFSKLLDSCKNKKKIQEAAIKLNGTRKEFKAIITKLNTDSPEESLIMLKLLNKLIINF